MRRGPEARVGLGGERLWLLSLAHSVSRKGVAQLGGATHLGGVNWPGGRYARVVNDATRAERLIDRALVDAAGVIEGLRRDALALAACARGAERLASCLRAGNKVLICGNGGSMADAMHFAEELTGRFRKDRPALAAMACSDPTHLTCVANDYGFEQVFSRWVEGVGRAGDCLIVLSTSGNSANIARAVDAARGRGIGTIGLLGRGGGGLAGACDVELVVPGVTSDRIQELHMLILHAWVEAIEGALGFGG